MADVTKDDLSAIRWMTVTEVAEALRLSKMTVYRLIRAGELPASRVGRNFRVQEDHVREYLIQAFQD